MNHGYEYDVNITPAGAILREVTYVEPGNIRTNIMREVIDTTDRLTRGALIDLGWSPPPAPSLPKKCLVDGCTNTSSQGKFNGDPCMPCHTMLTTGNIKSGATFIHDLRDRMRKIAGIAN